MLFTPNESLHPISFCKFRNDAFAVLPNTLHKIISQFNIERAIPSIRKKVNIENHCPRLWTPACAGASGINYAASFFFAGAKRPEKVSLLSAISSSNLLGAKRAPYFFSNARQSATNFLVPIMSI